MNLLDFLNKGKFHNILVSGPKSTGKSTLAQSMYKEGVSYGVLDDIITIDELEDKFLFFHEISYIFVTQIPIEQIPVTLLSQFKLIINTGE